MIASKSNPQNDRVKRDYLIWLKEACQRSASTVEQVRHAIDRLEMHTDYRDFGAFNKDLALAFKRGLLASNAKNGGGKLSKSTAYHVLRATKDFLAWLHSQRSYRKRFQATDIQYLNLTWGEERQARSKVHKPFPSLEEYRKAVLAMPTFTEIERRDQALMAFILLTGARAAAVISLKIKHFDIQRMWALQDARDVRTKFSKTIDTFVYPVGGDIEKIVTEWVDFITTEKRFGPDDPMFPSTENALDTQGNFGALSLARTHWSNSGPVRKVFREAFENVGLSYFNPHSVRKTLTQLAYSLRLAPEELKIWSQNMGHDQVLTTLNSYGAIPIERQEEVMKGLRLRGRLEEDDKFVVKIADMVAARLNHRS